METRHQQELHDALMHKRVELKERTAAIRKDTGIQISADFAEQAVDLENADVLDELAREAVEELREIDLAFARERAGQLGLCVNCGKAIRYERLRVVPWASHCMTCADSSLSPTQ